MQSAIDGLLSAGAGGALIVFGFVSPNGTFGFVTQIGDAIVVVLLCVLVFFQPIRLIKNSFIEISGGALNDSAILDEYYQGPCHRSDSLIARILLFAHEHKALTTLPAR